MTLAQTSDLAIPVDIHLPHGIMHHGRKITNRRDEARQIPWHAKLLGISTTRVDIASIFIRVSIAIT